MSVPVPSPVSDGEVSGVPRVTLEHRQDAAIARFPRGKVDGIAVRELFEAAMSLTDQSQPRLVVDLAGLDMATSGLMGILVQLHKRFTLAKGRLSVAVPDPRIRASFEIANLHLVLDLHEQADSVIP